ncbi:MAG: hypothetical protein ACOX02_01910 [Acholeplasmatales bacterium]
MKKTLIILFSIVFLTSCFKENDFEKINKKVVTPITFERVDHYIKNYPLRFVKDNNLEEGRMGFYKSYIILNITSEYYYFDVTTKILSVREENNLTKLKTLENDTLETLLTEIKERLNIEFILLDYKVNEIVNEMLSEKFENITYREVSVTKNPNSSSIEIDNFENTSFGLFKQALNQLKPYISFDSNNSVSIRLTTFAKKTRIESILINKEIGYEKLYEGQETEFWNEKFIDIKNFLDTL